MGCPHQCVFCNQSRITSVSKELVTGITEDTVKRIVEEHLMTLPSGDKTVELSFFGGTFTAVERKKQEELLKCASGYLRSGDIQHIRCSTRPDYIDKEIMDMVTEYGMDIIELGVQSLDDEVLRLSGRGHTAESVALASELIRKYGVTLGHQLMPGLPGDTYEKDIESAGRSISMKPDMIRIYPTLVIKDTPLEKMYESGKYVPYSLDEAVRVSYDMAELYRKEGITILRMGLQATEEIAPGKSLVAGPYHPAFGELCESYGIWKEIENETESLSSDVLLKKTEIIVNPRSVSMIYSGSKKYFLKYREDHRDVETLVTQDEREKYGDICLCFYGTDRSGNSVQIERKLRCI